MANTDFLSSYNKLREAQDDGMKFFIESYHHDSNGEPFLHIGAYPDRVRLEYTDDEGLLILIITPETTLTFIGKNHNTNISNGTVVFSSKHDDETHTFIELG